MRLSTILSLKARAYGPHTLLGLQEGIAYGPTSMVPSCVLDKAVLCSCQAALAAVMADTAQVFDGQVPSASFVNQRILGRRVPAIIRNCWPESGLQIKRVRKGPNWMGDGDLTKHLSEISPQVSCSLHKSKGSATQI